LTPREQAALKRAQAVNPEAYQSYLKGRYFWNKRTPDGLKAALAYFNQAIEEDPKYAKAYSGLADTYALLGDWQYGVMSMKEALPKAKAAAIKALELDSSLSEAHTSPQPCFAPSVTPFSTIDHPTCSCTSSSTSVPTPVNFNTSPSLHSICIWPASTAPAASF
jgi:tetratricopeptide (TPR) repeat protein